MEFGCSVCEYTSAYKHSVVRHINKKKVCGKGIREVIEIPIDIHCEWCNKNFSTKENLDEHIKNHCKQKTKIQEEKIKKLEDKIKELEKRPTTTNNITNNNTYNIIVVNNYEDTKTEHLTDKAYYKLLKESEVHELIPSLIKQIHFNPDVPENHNIFISNRNKNNKHMQIFKDGHWETINKNTEIDNIIYDKETNISDWVSEKGEKYPKAAEKYNEYLEYKDDEETSKMIKDSVELTLYNNRHLIKN